MNTRPAVPGQLIGEPTGVAPTLGTGMSHGGRGAGRRREISPPRPGRVVEMPELFIGGIFHLMVAAHSGPQVTETTERETKGKRGLLYKTKGD